MKRGCSFLLFIFLTLTAIPSTPPYEGLWLPVLIKDFNFNEMRRSGLKLTAEQLYDINKPSIKDAIVQIGTGSGSVISNNGLVVTTYRNIFPFISGLSSPEKNLVKDGFWANNRTEELPCLGLTVTFLVQMQNVTEEVLGAIPENIPEYKRAELIDRKIKKIIAAYQLDQKYKVSVESYCSGNEYYLYVFQEFSDIRLVVSPPSSIAQFGGEEELFQWPRHNADFCILRIYGAPDGTSASYSASNEPIKPKYFLPISLKGYQENEFNMVWGYPETSDRYMSSAEIKFQTEKFKIPFVESAGVLLTPLKNGIFSKETSQLTYAPFYQKLAHQYKLFKGETDNMTSLNIISEIQVREQKMRRWNLMQDEISVLYDSVFIKIDSVTNSMDINLMRCYWYGNLTLQSSRFMMLPYFLKEVTPNPKTEQEIDTIIAKYKRYIAGSDTEMEVKMMQASFALWGKLPEGLKPKIGPYVTKFYNNEYNNFAFAIINKSIFSSETALRKFLENPKKSVYQVDPLLRYYHEVIKTISKGEKVYQEFEKTMIPLKREYSGVLFNKIKNEEKSYYFDGNSSLRVSYGNISGYQPYNAISYQYYTNHIGIIEKMKSKSNDPQYKIPAKLESLFLESDFGPYEYEEEMKICFLSNADSGEGSNGSAVLNGQGALIGMMFDVNHESLGNTYLFNNNIHRSICLDIRYMLFLIEKYGNSAYLFDEMELIQ
jgi:hypothetical protein